MISSRLIVGSAYLPVQVLVIGEFVSCRYFEIFRVRMSGLRIHADSPNISCLLS